MPKQPINVSPWVPDVPPPRRTHKCTVCGHVGEWGDAWSWYGSVVELENRPNMRVPKFCTEECETAWGAQHAAMVERDAKQAKRRRL